MPVATEVMFLKSPWGTRRHCPSCERQLQVMVLRGTEYYLLCMNCSWAVPFPYVLGLWPFITGAPKKICRVCSRPLLSACWVNEKSEVYLQCSAQPVLAEFNPDLSLKSIELGVSYCYGSVEVVSLSLFPPVLQQRIRDTVAFARVGEAEDDPMSGEKTYAGIIKAGKERSFAK